MNDLLSLKVLILANEPATQELRELVNSNEDDKTLNEYSTGPVATTGVTRLLNHQSSSSSTTTLISTNGQKGVVRASDFTLSSTNLIAPGDKQIPNVGKDSSPFSNHSLPILYSRTSSSAEGYSRVWSVLDQLELSLRKVELAKWEHERIKKKLSLGGDEENNTKRKRKEAMYTQRLRDDLSKFGLSEAKVNAAVLNLKMRDAGLGFAQRLIIGFPRMRSPP